MSFYDRQQNMELNTDIAVFIVGMGGVGFNAALQLAMSGVPQFYLCDYDIIEPHNLNRIPVGTSEIGRKKIYAAKNKILGLRGETSVVVFDGRFNEMMLPSSNINWIMDCSDRLQTQIEIHKIASSKGINYCKVGYDGDNISVFSSPAQWGEDVEEEEEGGYTITPSWSAPAHLVAALGVAKILKYHDKEVSTSIGQILNR